MKDLGDFFLSERYIVLMVDISGSDSMRLLIETFEATDKFDLLLMESNEKMFSSDSIRVDSSTACKSGWLLRTFASVNEQLEELNCVNFLNIN